MHKEEQAQEIWNLGFRKAARLTIMPHDDLRRDIWCHRYKESRIYKVGRIRRVKPPWKTHVGM